jgi:molybdenum cofactor guanylyltransferase
MGSDKALLPFHGNPLGGSLASLIARTAGTVVLVGNPQLSAPLGYPAIPDLYPGEGPLGGILTALEHSASDWNLVVACDMPGLTADFLAGLLNAAFRSPSAALLPVGPGGRPEPLCAVYHRRARNPLGGVFAGGERKITRALEKAGIAVCLWPVSDAGIFQNVNTPEDWAPWAPHYAAK